MAHYIHDEKNNRIEGMSKEEIYALIDEVIQTGELPTDTPAAFVTALKSIVDGQAYKIGFCTQAEYNQLEAQGELEANALYIITDDTTEDDIEAAIEGLETRTTAAENSIAEIQNNIGNSTLSVTASTTSTDCFFRIWETTKNVIVKTGNIVFVEYDISASLDLDAGFMSSGTAYGTINITVPSGYRPTLAVALNLDYTTTGDMTSKEAVASKLNSNGTMTITCSGSYSGAYVADANFTIRLYGVYTTL